MRLLYALVLVLLLPGLTGASDVRLTAEEHAWLDEHGQHLHLSFEPKFPPIEFLSPEGRFAGLSADLMAAVEKRLAITLVKTPVQQWTEVLDGLRSGDTAISPCITPTEERRQYIIFTEPYANIPIVIITRRGDATNLTLDNLNNRIVDVVRGYVSADLVRAGAQGRFQVREVDNIQEGLRDVSFGLADALVENQAVAAWYISREGITNLQIGGTTGVSEPQAIGVSSRYPLLASAMQKALKSIPPQKMQGIVKKWVSLDVPLFDPDTLLAIKIAIGLTSAVVAVLLLLAWRLRHHLREKMLSLEQTQEVLKENLSRFQMTLDVTHAGFWEYYPQENREENSPEWYTMLGYPAQYGSRTLNAWIDLLHPDDREDALFLFQEYLNSGGHGVYEREFRMRMADGTWCWVLGKGRTVEWNEEGKPIKVLGINLDIQRLKESQEEAAQSRALTRALLEQTSHMIGLINPDGVMLMANNTALQMIDNRPEDVIGQPFWATPWWPDSGAAELRLRAIIARSMNGETTITEVEHLDSDKQTRIVEFAASPFRNAQGVIESIIIEGRDITERKVREQRVSESEKRFRSIFENAPYSITINSLFDGRYVDANNVFFEQSGYTRDDLTRLERDQLGTLPKEHVQLLMDSFSRGEPVHNLQTQILYPDGRVRHILYSGELIELEGEPCILSIAPDITELRQIQDALRSSEEKYTRLFQLSPDIVILTRQRDGVLVEANDAALQLVGFTREEALGRPMLDLNLFADPSRRDIFLAQLYRDGLVENFEFEIRHRQGHIIRCSASSRPLMINDEPCNLTMARDVTNLRRMEEMLVQTEKMHSLGGIAAGIAHEINNPLGIILQGIQTVSLRLQPDFPKNLEVAAENGVEMSAMQRYMESRKIPVFLTDIEKAALRASQIIRHMLDFSRKTESRVVQCNLQELIEKAISLASNDFDLKKNYDFKSIEIIREFDDALGLIPCTETDLEQVFLNLLKNAAQAMADAEPPTAKPRIRIATHKSGDSIRIEFEDNGPGIPREQQTRIFEPFFTTKPTGVGTGLGLSVSYFIIATGHGGTMRVTSPPEGGTVFIIELPCLQNTLPHGWTDSENHHT